MDTSSLDFTDDQPFDVTPSGQALNLMDPYELFSTPPNDMILSSTPSKPKGRGGIRKAPNSARKVVLNKRLAANKRSSISFDMGKDSDIEANTSTSAANKTTLNGKSTRVLRNRNLNRSRHLISANHNTSSSTSGNNAKAKRTNNRRQESDNLWDKCLKSNPELAQFVDNFNQSLEEALSKPLDMAES